MSPRRFEGRHAIVTGASRGIGAAIANGLAAEGADVVVTARTIERHAHLPGSLNETVDKARAHGTRVEAVAADLADEESRASIVPRALELLEGRVDILVNNAAAAIYQSLLDYPLRRRRLMFEINLHAPVDLMQAVIPSMQAHGEGWILNLSSASAKQTPGPPYAETPLLRTIGLYGSTKAALNRVTNAIAIELFGSGVRVNTVEPKAAVLSEGADHLVGSRLRADQIEPMATMVEAALQLCCCEPELTGQVLQSQRFLATRAQTS